MHGLDTLGLFDFGSLLQALANNLKVGVLAVRSGKRVKYLRLERNQLSCIYVRKPKVSLQKVLYNHRSVDKPTLRRAFEVLEESPEMGPLGRYLSEQGLVDRQRMTRAVQYQVLEEVLEIFYWKNVGFEFYTEDGHTGFDTTGFIQVGEPIHVDTVLIKCTRIIDDIAKFNEVTPSLRDIYELHIDSFEQLKALVPDRAQREFVLLLDGVRDMREVLREMRMNRFEVLEFFYQFRKQERIRPKNAFELLMLAENRRADFSLEKRARLLERVNDFGVEGFEVLLPLARTYEEMGKPAKASPYYLRHARRCFFNNDLEGALKAVESACKLTPDDAPLREFQLKLLEQAQLPEEASAAYRALADIRMQSGEMEGAIDALGNSVRLTPSDDQAWAHLSRALTAAGRGREGAWCMRRAGDMCRSRDEPDEAEAHYRRALELAPGAWSVRYRLVDLFHSAGRNNTSVQELGKLISFVEQKMGHLDTDTRLLHLEWIETRTRDIGGMVSSAAGDLGRAFSALGRDEHAITVFLESGDALALARRHSGSRDMYAEVIELDPSDIDARRKLARECEALGDRDRALGHLRRVGALLMGRKDYETAKQVFIDMLAVDPTCPDAHVGLAKAHLELGENELASVHYHRVGLLHRGCGRGVDALPYLREAVQKRPNNARLLEEYAELLLTTDQREETLQALSALVELRMNQGEAALGAIAVTKILEIDSQYPGARQILHEAARRLLRMADASEEMPAMEARRMVEMVLDPNEVTAEATAAAKAKLKAGPLGTPILPVADNELVDETVTGGRAGEEDDKVTPAPAPSSEG